MRVGEGGWAAAVAGEIRWRRVVAVMDLDGAWVGGRRWVVAAVGMRWIGGGGGESGVGGRRGRHWCRSIWAWEGGVRCGEERESRRCDGSRGRIDDAREGREGAGRRIELL